MNVSGILLNPSAEAQLESYLEEPAHALLLSNPKGSGKAYVATTLAETLLTVDHLENHAYFRRLQPDNGTISIAQIRELIGFFRLKVPGTNKIRRAAIIEDAETMGTDAQNALLKVLEEPPADSVLILTSSRPQALLPTIRSRLQHIQLSVPSSEALTTFFQEQGYDQSAIRLALLRSGTDIAEAKRILDEGSAQADTTIDLAKKALTGNSYDRLIMVDSLSKRKETAAEFVDVLATITVASMQAAAAKGAASIDKWQIILQAVDVAQESLARSGNAKLVLTELMLAI